MDTAGLEILNNYKHNYTEAVLTPRSAHSAAIYAKTWGAVGRHCAATGGTCEYDSDCPSEPKNNFCNTRAGSAIHTESHGAQKGVFIDTTKSKGDGLAIDGQPCTNNGCNNDAIHINGGRIFISNADFQLDEKTATRVYGSPEGPQKISKSKEKPCVIPTKSRVVAIHGNAADRLDCMLEDGWHDGQALTLIGYTWKAGLAAADNVEFGSQTPPVLSEKVGDVMTWQAVWVQSLNKWWETSRLVRG